MKENKVIMSALKSLVSLSSQAALLFLLTALAMQTKTAEAQNCPGLNNLTSCQAFLLPGAANPTTACCNALQGVQHDCVCNALRIAQSLPTKCNLPPLTCSKILRTFLRIKIHCHNVYVPLYPLLIAVCHTILS